MKIMPTLSTCGGKERKALIFRGLYSEAFKQDNYHHIIITILYHKFQMSMPLGKNPSHNKSLKIEYVCNSKPY